MEPRNLKISEYAVYIGEATGTVYNRTAEFFRSGSTIGLYVKPMKVGRGRSIRFDKKKLDRALDALS